MISIRIAKVAAAKVTAAKVTAAKVAAACSRWTQASARCLWINNTQLQAASTFMRLQAASTLAASTLDTSTFIHLLGDTNEFL